jgi:hypothetical protein
MDSRKLNDWLQVVGIFGVIVSLVFVGLEIQQSREIAVADIHQQKAAMAIQVQQAMVVPEEYSLAVRKLLQDKPLDELEKGLMQFAQNPWFQYWENTYFQYQLGLLSEPAWEASRNAMRGRLKRPIYQEWWESDREYWRADFAEEVDRVLEEVRNTN